MTSLDRNFESQYVEFLSSAFVLSDPYNNPLMRHVDLSQEGSVEAVTAMGAEKAFRAAQEIIRIVSGISSIKDAEGKYDELAEKVINDVQQVHVDSQRVQVFLEDVQAGEFLKSMALTGYVATEPIYNNLCHGRRGQVRTAELIQPLYPHPSIQNHTKISDFSPTRRSV